MEERARTFIELMALQAVGEDRYMSLSPGWAPSGRGAAYGGIIYALATWAAAQTVGDGFVVHNVHGYFTLPGQVDRPNIIDVERTTDGRGYCTRTVTVRQPLEPSSRRSESSLEHFDTSDAQKKLGKICFKSICSFKKDERYDIGHQENKDIRKQYASVLASKKPKDHVYAPAVDAPWYIDSLKEYPQPMNFPGLEVRKVEMEKYNADKDIMAYRQLHFYRLLGSIPPSQPNLHACAHLYASDRNSLFLIMNALGFPDHVDKIGSLSHSVVIHVDSKRILLPETDGENEDDWFVQEAWTPRSEAGRGQHESKIWTSAGLHIASSWQDGLIRRAVGDDARHRASFAVGGRSKI